MNRTLLASSALAAIWLGAPEAALAQTEPRANANTIGEVVVTARREQENLQTTPVAVTAVTAEALTKQQVSDLQDLQVSTPSLSVSTGGPGGPGIVFASIRGQINTGANSVSDSAVATYVDGVYMARSTSGNLGFLDPAQVEILRGPQGTLFGRNTTGGALNVTSVQPNGQFGGYARASYGNYNATKLEGAVTLPILGDELSARIAGQFASRDGYFENVFSGQELGDLNHAYAGRLTVRWAPENMPLTLTVSAEQSTFEDDGQSTKSMGINTGLRPLGVGPTLANAFAARGLNPADFVYRKGVNFDQNYAITNSASPEINTPRDWNRLTGFAATLEVDLGSWDLKSITAWRSADAENALDNDGTPLGLIEFASEYRQEQVSQELQASTTIGALDLIGGLFYFAEQGDERTDVFALGGVLPLLGIPAGIARNYGQFEAKSKAVFAQANYRFTDRLRGTIGYRYTWDERRLDKRNIDNINVPTSCAGGVTLTPQGVCSTQLEAKFEYPAWTVGLDYQVTDDAFLYVRSGRASMAGGFNTRPSPPGTETFRPETLTDIEIGAKVDWFDRRLRTNLAVFRSETEGAQRQVNILLANRSTSYTANSGDVEIKGVELELTALPWRGMEVTASSTYLDASYKKGTFVDVDARGLPRDRSGEPVPYTPEWAFTVGLTQDFELSLGVLTAHLDWFYTDDKINYPETGDSVISAANAATATRLATIQSYGLLNGRLTMALENGVKVSLWGRNLTDKEYFTQSFSTYNALGFVSQWPGDPRTYGIQLDYTF